jgi:DMSO/TMAO reductase YedYZ heme-binding membrane subunit
VIALTSPYLWYATRATGFVALALFTTVVVLGSLVALRVGGNFVGRFELNELHRSLSIVAMAFVVLHIITTVADSYVSTGIASAFVPFTSAYKELGVSVGAVAFDLLLAVWISSLLKVRIPNQTWRFIHWFSWIAASASVLHAVQTGTDASHGVGFDLAIICAVVMAVAGGIRLVLRPTRAAGRTALSPLQRAASATRNEPSPVHAAPPRGVRNTQDPFPRVAAPLKKRSRR